jgi:3'-phosphoadenosine 5'-phosphosulfate sulfotransferase (PAPS reductase)/FAD synthetase
MKVGNRVKFPYGRDKEIRSGEVINILPDGKLEVFHGTRFTMVDPSEIVETLPARRRVRYIPFFEEGGKLESAKRKWRKVYREYLDGDLKHGTTGETVTDRDMAMAIAYSEARKIYPLYNVYANGGSPTNEFTEICLHPAQSPQLSLLAEQVYDFNMKANGKSYQGTIELPSHDKGIANVIWDQDKPDNWQDLEATVTNRAYQYADNKYGLGGFVVGTLLGSYIGFKIGSMREKSEDPFKTERKIAQKIKERKRKKKSSLKTGGQVQMFEPSGEKELTVLSFGGGQDSTALFYLYLYNEEFRKKYAPGDFVMVMANTGNEYPETYAHVKEVKKLADQHGITFAFLEDYKYTTDSWKGGVLDKMRRNQVVFTVKLKSCTIGLKIEPIYKWLDEYVCKNYPELNAPKPCSDTDGKKALKMFAKEYGKINVMLGIAKGEEDRVGKSEDAGQKWFKESIKRIYPLIDMGIDRAGAQDIIAKSGHSVPPPSNCMVCPYQNDEEILLLSLKHPDMFKKWTDLEQAKLDRYAKELNDQTDLLNLSLDTPIKYNVGDQSMTGYVSGVNKHQGEIEYEVTRTGKFKIKKTDKKDSELIFDEAKKSGLMFDDKTKAIDLVIPLAEQLDIYVSKNDTASKVKPKLINRINYLNTVDRVSADQIARVINPGNKGVKMDYDTLPEKVKIIQNKPEIIKQYKKKDGTWDMEKLEKYRFSHGHCGVKGAYMSGGVVKISDFKDSDKIFIRVLNKYKSYTNLNIKPANKDNTKFMVNVTVYGFHPDPNEFNIVDVRSHEIISKAERDELLKKIEKLTVLESVTY